MDPVRRGGFIPEKKGQIPRAQTGISAREDRLSRRTSNFSRFPAVRREPGNREGGGWGVALSAQYQMKIVQCILSSTLQSAPPGLHSVMRVVPGVQGAAKCICLLADAGEEQGRGTGAGSRTNDGNAGGFPTVSTLPNRAGSRIGGREGNEQEGDRTATAAGRDLAREA